MTHDTWGTQILWKEDESTIYVERVRLLDRYVVKKDRQRAISVITNHGNPCTREHDVQLYVAGILTCGAFFG